MDQDAIEIERERLAMRLSKYAKQDRWNFDETGLYAL